MFIHNALTTLFLPACLPSDLNSLLPMVDSDDFLSPLPEPSASGSVQLQLSPWTPCEFPKRPSSTVSFLIRSACRIYISGDGLYTRNFSCVTLYLPYQLTYQVVNTISSVSPKCCAICVFLSTVYLITFLLFFSK